MATDYISYRSAGTVPLEMETKLYTMLQGSSKCNVNNAHLRNLMRKLEVRKQRRSKGLKVQPLERRGMEKAVISMPSINNVLVSHSIGTKDYAKNAKNLRNEIDKMEYVLRSTGLTEDLNTRVLDRFQASQPFKKSPKINS